MIDQLRIGEKASFDDFLASVAERHIKMPKKKSIKDTVPFSNKTYDFSGINGEVYWEERELEYVFEITADTPEELEELKSRFSAWVAGVHEQELHDPHIPDHHFVATYDDMDPEDDEGLDKTTLTVTFTAYPYKVANYPKVGEVTVPASGAVEVVLLNESDHPVPLTVVSEGITLEIGLRTYVFGAGTITDETVKLPTGLTSVKLRNTATAERTVRLSFYEEVF